MSKTLTGSIDLTKMKTALKTMKNKAGEQVECLVIPIKDNHLYKGEKGIYMNIRVSVHDNQDQYGNIAMITKTVDMKSMFGEGKSYNSLTDKEKELHKQGTPILGNLKEIGGMGSVSQPSPMMSSDDDNDELPF